MANSLKLISVVSILFMLAIATAADTPPGIAKNPSHARCLIKKYKHCYNLEHVCPKFCPDSCTVECVSCKPICSDGSAPPPTKGGDDDGDDDDKGGDKGGDKGDDDKGDHKGDDKGGDDKGDDKGKDKGDDKDHGKGDDKDHSPTGKTPSPPTPPSYDNNAMRRKRCRNRNFPQCYGVEHTCPSSCPTTCEIDCNTCKPVCQCDYPGAVCQDPRFIGGDGITFYFHGKKDKDFCLVTDPNLHINAHFIGKRNDNMKRDFTWVQSIGVLFDNHNLFIGAKKTATWDDANDHLALSFDGSSVNLPSTEGAKWQSETTPTTTVKRDVNTNSVIVEIEGIVKITAKVVPITAQESRVHNYGITNEDCFAHLELGFKFYSLSENVNGVLGQTYRGDYVSRVKMGVSMPVLGGEKKFAVSSLYSADCAVSQFVGGGKDEASRFNLELPSMKCGSGIDGTGVVCKK